MGVRPTAASSVLSDGSQLGCKHGALSQRPLHPCPLSLLRNATAWDSCLGFVTYDPQVTALLPLTLPLNLSLCILSFLEDVTLILLFIHLISKVEQVPSPMGLAV